MTIHSPNLYILIDYDNLEVSVRSSPLFSVVGMLLKRVPTATLDSFGRIKVRLYGGWYGATSMSRQGQALAPQIANDFPRPYGYISIAGEVRTVTVDLDLAVGPVHSPGTVLYETFAENRPVRRFRWINKPWSGCTNPNACGMDSIAKVNGCGNSGCNVKLPPLLKRDEQKQVDTLLVTDLIYLGALNGLSQIVVISSDTDMWPGILLTTAHGCNVLHIHTKAGYATQRRLLSTLGPAARQYMQTSV